MVLSDHLAGELELGTAERRPDAARSGSVGYAVEAGPGQGVTFSVVSYVEKGENVRYSFWARSPVGAVTVRPVVVWVERGKEDAPNPPTTEAGAFTVGQEWTQIRFTADNRRILRHVLLSLCVGPDQTLHLDDFQIEQPVWKMATPEGPNSPVISASTTPPTPTGRDVETPTDASAASPTATPTGSSRAGARRSPAFPIAPWTSSRQCSARSFTMPTRIE